ncbi:D-serine ammonia-lyase [Purpureocillium takamizusanense]|uniref:D-serine ammonia-lyase n=1 Tax=Purpureocillium takamizusanense TaxID=2060973 RepID=A0A9Q8VGW3_9HYPO|nr:D-serine ammonia-lyase [Purpureocillium takamizusanense]UNI24304.1 D-serine ammonia-lyase [Purpureocillium takamizusanense]
MISSSPRTLINFKKMRHLERLDSVYSTAPNHFLNQSRTSHFLCCQLNTMAGSQKTDAHVEDMWQLCIGKDIYQVPKPTVVLDRAKMQRHCQSLLDAVDHLGVDFRAHVKTHKTKEGVRLQAGETRRDVRLVASTIAEMEYLLPVLYEFRNSGRNINVLYGIPLPLSQVGRLADLGRKLGRGSISILVDHIAQLIPVSRFFEQAGFPVDVYLKVDTGYHRAGLPPSSINKDELVVRLMQLEGEGKLRFVGLYSHSSLSYNDSTPKEAMANLEGEINGCLDALCSNAHMFPKGKDITISVGASPQVTAVQNLMAPEDNIFEHTERLRKTMQKVINGYPAGLSTKLELHAGVYSVLDVQQLSTRARVQLGDYEDEIAISVMAEVCSIYNNGERRQPEALVAVGVLGLGREPCAAYEGWGVIHRDAYSPGAKPNRRLIVSRVSQEHCIVSWERGAGAEIQGSLPPIPLEVGQTVRIYPNHACITGALYGRYLVVDSSSDGQDETRVVDVWTRASGW